MSDMTSAVAIDLLDNLIGMVDDNQGNDYDTAFHMAIDALKAQENKQLANSSPKLDSDSGDLISRQAAISVIAKWMLEYGGECEGHERNALKQAAEGIKELSPAQPKHDISKANFMCPICGAEMEVSVSGWEGGTNG